MSTEIIRPSGAGSSTQLTPSTGANWSCVDEETKSETDYVGTSGVQKKDLYAMADPVTIGEADTINSITLYAYTRIGSTDGTGTIALSWKVGATSIKGSLKSVSTTYSLKSQTWTTKDGAAWTLADIQSLEAGYELDVGYTWVRVCQFWVEIDYTEATGCPRQMMYRMRMMS